MHRLDPMTTVLIAALALMTAFALASETPFAGVRGRAAAPSAASGSRATVAGRAHEVVALNAAGVDALPPAPVRQAR